MADEHRILLLEPIPADAELMELQIRQSGLQVVTRRVPSRELFVKAIEEFNPSLVILTTSIPRLDIPDMIRSGRTEYPGVRWMVVAAAGSEELAAKCLKAGAVDYIPKRAISKLGAALKSAVEEPEEDAANVTDREDEPPESSGAAIPDEDAYLFRAIIEHSHDLIAVVDLEGRRVYNSPSYGPLLEDPDTLEGTSSFVDVHPDDRQKVMEVFRETVVEGKGKRLEYRLIGRDGGTRYIESQGSVIPDSDGDPKYVVVFSRDITARRQAGEVIRWTQERIAGLEGEDFFPGLVRAVADGLDVKYALVSEVIDRRSGRVRVLAFWAAGSPAPAFEYDVHGTTCEQVILNGKTVYFPDGVQKLFPNEALVHAMNASSYLGTPLLDAANSPIGHLFIFHDRPIVSEDLARSVLIVAASRASAQLSHLRELRFRGETELKTRLVLEELPDGVIVTDLEDIVTYVNRRMADLTGYHPEEIVGKLASSLLVTEDGRRDLFMHDDRRRRGLSDRYATVLTRKDGSTFGVTISAGPQRSPTGEVIGTLALIVPRADDDANETGSEGSDAAFLEKTQDAAFVCDPEDTILFWNSAAARLYGWSASEARGKKSTDLLHTVEIHALGGAAHTAIIQGYWGGELEQRRKDGSTVLVDSRWTLIRTAEGRPASLLVLCTDITGKKEAEVYALRMQRMTGFASLGSAIAADLEAVFNPMLTAIPPVVDRLTDDQARKAVNIIAAGAQQGRDLAVQIRSLAETGTGGTGLCDMAVIVRNTERALSASLNATQHLKLQLPSTLWSVAGTPVQIEEALGNICTNAREAMPAGGTIRIVAENCVLDQATAAGMHVAAGRYVMVSVSDTGVGIPVANVARVVEPFFTTKAPGKSTGLGLSTANTILQNLKGCLTIHSEQGKGTIVKVFIPASEHEGASGGPRLGHGETILVAHSQASMRDLLQKILEAHGYDTLVAAEGSETVALFRQHHASIACVVLDLAMQYIDGSSLGRVLATFDPEVRLLTTDDLPHPFSTRTLLKEISTLLIR
jgi:two-component system cell cycle sensor histidine kinase/response regulator CckA